MLFLKDRTQEKIQAAVEEALQAQAKELADMRSTYRRELESLRDQVQALQADRAEREVELTRDWAKLLDDHRRHNEAGVKGVLASVAGLRDEIKAIPAPVAVEIPDPADLRPLQERTYQLSRELGEVSDLATYLLASPREVVREVATPGAATVSVGGWVRPAGAR